MPEERPRCCPCGKTASFSSTLLEAVFCSDECYWKARKEAGQEEGKSGQSLVWKANT